MTEYMSRTTPYKHQKEAFERFKDAEYFALIFDMGTGKTKTAIDIATYKYNKGEINAVLLIAPNNIHTQWLSEQFPIHCPIPYAYMIYSAQKRTNKIYSQRLDRFIPMQLPKLKIFAVNVEAFQSDTVIPYIAKFVKQNKVFIIEDESSRIKNPTAKRTKAITKLNQYGSRCILTGTPATKSPFNLFSQYEFLKKDYFGCNYFVFQHRYGVMMRATNHVTGRPYNTLIDEKTFSMVKYSINNILNEKELSGHERILSQADYETISAMNAVSESVVRFIESSDKFAMYRNVDKLRDLLAPHTMTVRKEDCLDLPQKIYETIPVKMSKEQKEIYNNLKKELYAEYFDKTLTVVNKLTLTTRLMQVVGGFFPYIDDDDSRKSKAIADKNVKLEALKEDLEEVDFTHTKVIVWGAYVSEIELIYKELSKTYNCCLYYGAVSVDNRSRIAQEFKDGKYDIFIGNVQTAGYGLNLQNATLQYFFSNTFMVEARLQAEDRSHRIGVMEACVYKDIVMEGTIDEKVTKAIKEGRDLNEYFKDMPLKEMLEDETENIV